MKTTPPLGLLLDVDGPIASPVSRSIGIDSITRDLVTLAGRGIPVVFNTGRTDAFLRDEVIKPLLAAGLAADARVYGVCEKGAVWFGATMTNFAGIQVDDSLTLQADAVAALRTVHESFTDWMFWDDGKRSMVSLEQRTDVDSAAFLPERDRFCADAYEALDALGIGVEWLGRRNAAEPTVRIDPTIISIDVEAVGVGKDLGAERALELLAASGEIPRVWRTVGDSRTDYAMADYLHAEGFEVAHVDVRPADGVPEKDYPIQTMGDLVNDDAGAAFLAECVERYR
ncbi:hypothetical protein [Marisediminicola sp. LYQ134]|uniref:hypothetical protein n=1 Tax=Marisediminicola sp. LYQ134 TaxID=3391061 RepID=UPI003982F5EA